MPNVFFRAKLLWQAGEREPGFLILNDYLVKEIGQPVFVAARRLLYSSLDPGMSFEDAVWAMLNDSEILQAPFGQVFSIIWNLNPNQIWILLLLNRNFYNDDYFWSVYGQNEDFVIKVSENDFEIEREWATSLLKNDFEMIADVLIASALKGILGSNASEGPNNGRAVLPLEDIQEVKEENWGSLKAMLLERLPKAYADCPPNFWTQLASNEPEEVVMRFLHDLFSEFGHSIAVAETRWKVIVRDHGAYANAVRTALENLLNRKYDPEWLREIVHVDAGFTTVKDGAAWIKALSMALHQQDFSELADSCSG
jgi:hypothetical protein